VEDDRFINQMKDAGLYVTSDLCKMEIPDHIIKKISSDTAAKYKICPYAEENGTLLLATNDALVYKNQDRVQAEVGQPFYVLATDDENMKAALTFYYHTGNFRSKDSTLNADDENTTPLKTKVKSVIHAAIDQGASDIHLLPYSGGIYISFRIHGHLIDLTDVYKFTSAETQQVINIIKGLDTSSNADANEISRSNNGRFSVAHGDKMIDIRMATVPVGIDQNGWQKINLRLLQTTDKVVGINDIGYLPEDLRAIKKTLYSTSNGLFIISGKTGAGKTTSLFAQLHYVRDAIGEPMNIMTIEDPIEIRDETFTQIQVRDALNDSLAFLPPEILNICLRSDPDAILYTEIRTAKDAKVAIEASETGIKVFTTVHARGCIATIARLLDLDISKVSLLSELTMIISQRLVGKLCPDCSKPHTLTAKESHILLPDELARLTNSNIRERNPRGCPKCQYGFIGRTAVAEYITFDMQLRDALLHQKSFQEISTTLAKRHFVSMWDKGLDLVATGQCDLQEIIHVIGRDEKEG
jgi:type II secretory ATPase GspE/PulE/Tfp pilus assembly ATPase PilB-like protein